MGPTLILNIIQSTASHTAFYCVRVKSLLFY